jgi:hypothetical protein
VLSWQSTPKLFFILIDAAWRLHAGYMNCWLLRSIRWPTMIKKLQHVVLL